jgi:hypothetical protein
MLMQTPGRPVAASSAKKIDVSVGSHAPCGPCLALSTVLHTAFLSLSQVRTASCAGTACVNSFGDEQLAVDMLADKLLFEALRFSVSAAEIVGKLQQMQSSQLQCTAA